MRTTVTIDDELLAEAKQLAARDRRTLGDVVEDGLRRVLTQGTGASTQADVLTLPTHGSGGLRPGVDLESREAVAMLLGDEEPRASA